MKSISLRFLNYIVFISASSIAISSYGQGNEKIFLQKAKPDLVKAFQDGKNEFWIVFDEQADVSAAKYLSTKEEKGEYVFKQLTETAERVQAKFLPLLKSKATSYQQFWIANSIYVKGDIVLAKEIAAYQEVKELLPNPTLHTIKPVEITPDASVRDATATNAIEWGLTKVKAPSVWALGYKGQGVVISGQDTGYDWDHPAIKSKYRGWNGSTADHNYNWFDAVKSGSGGSCGVNSPVPCDDNSHGTHTMGTMCGSEGSNEIGMAPDAKWIGCRNMDAGAGTPALYNSCFQWLLAPTNLSGQSPMPSKAPHVINNSWGCPTSEGCNTSNFSTMQTAVNNLRAAGVVVVVSAGNDGSGCNTITTPAAIFEGSFSVGSTTSSDAMSSFSSRGNVTVDGSNRIKPNVSAPGSNIRSSVPGTGYSSMSGTSMAGPHVAGAVALLISAAPTLAGQVDTIESILERTSVKINMGQTCGGTSPTTYPNNTIGHGRIDILAAVNEALTVSVPNLENQRKNGFLVFPNPAHDKVSIRFQNVKDQSVVITLFNTTGQAVAEKTETIFNNSFETFVQDLPKGFYMVRIKTADKSYYGKLIKE